jgi:hypothetical protein
MTRETSAKMSRKNSLTAPLELIEEAWLFDARGRYHTLRQVPVRGADRDRTDDLRLAKPALSQLSYSPGLARIRHLPTGYFDPRPIALAHRMVRTQACDKLAPLPHVQGCDRARVGQGRVELPTSRLSGVRSNHLSYWPGWPVGRRHDPAALAAGPMPGENKAASGDTACAPRGRLRPLLAWLGPWKLNRTPGIASAMPPDVGI